MLCRYNAVLYPVTHFVCEMLPEQMRESTRTELFFDDLEKLPSMEVARICEWLTEKVDGFSSKTRAEPKDVEEEVQYSFSLARTMLCVCPLMPAQWLCAIASMRGPVYILSLPLVVGLSACVYLSSFFLCHSCVKSGFSSLTCSKTANRNVNGNQDNVITLLANKMLVPRM